MVNESTKLTEPAHVYLLEDALELWLAVLETSQVADPATLQLAENLHPILGKSLMNYEKMIVNISEKCCRFSINQDAWSNYGY